MRLEWDFSELTEFADNLLSVDLEFTFRRITKEIAEVLLKYMRDLTPIGKTGQLIAGWNGKDFLVRPVKDGYRVDIVNETEYALAVNDGHESHNQYGGPYQVENRVKVKSPHKWQKGDSTVFVYGHFFVERGILQLKNTTEIEQIIMQELQKWWRSV